MISLIVFSKYFHEAISADKLLCCYYAYKSGKWDWNYSFRVVTHPLIKQHVWPICNAQSDHCNNVVRRPITLASLPLDEAVASRAVFAIVSRSSRQAIGRKRFWSQLNNSQTVRDRPFGRAIEWSNPQLPRTPNRGVANQRTQIWTHRRAAWSPVWWWPCLLIVVCL